MKGLDAFTVDLNKEEAGAWEQVGDMSFLVARAGNKEWKKLNKKLEARAKAGLGRNKEIPAEKQMDIIIELLATTAVLDWKDVTLGGKKVAFSKEKALEILSDPKFRPLTEVLLDSALDQERYMKEQIEEDEKKLSE